MLREFREWEDKRGKDRTLRSNLTVEEQRMKQRRKSSSKRLGSGQRGRVKTTRSGSQRLREGVILRWEWLVFSSVKRKS